MTKGELVGEIGRRYARFSHREAEVMVNSVFDTMTEALAQGERIELRGFGGLSVKERAARTARNPRTGEAVQIPARRVPVFKIGKELRERINGNTAR